MATVKTVTLRLNALTDEANRKLLTIRKNTQALVDANPVELKVKLEAAGARAQMAVLRRELSRPVDVSGGRGGILGLLGGLGGLLGAGGQAAPAGAAGAAGAAGVAGAVPPEVYAAGALSGLAGLIPALAAAGAGFAAFGALAIPTLTKLAASSRALKDVKTVFGSMVAAMRPDVVKIFNQAMRILVGLLPQLLPFAKATATALEGLLKGFASFASSPGFGVFLNQMQKLTGPTITTLGEGFGKVTVALGKLLISLANPNALRMARYFFDALAGFLTGLAWTITWTTNRIILRLHQWAVLFDEVRHNIAADIHNISGWIDALRVTWVTVGHSLEATANAVVATFDQWRHSIAVKVTAVASYFAALPGKITGVFRGALTWLYTAGKNVVQGLWNGLLFIWHKVTSFISGIGAWIRAHKGPVSLDANLLEPAGRALMSGLLRGLVGGFGGVAHFIGGIAGQIASFFGFGGGNGVVALGKAMAAAVGWTGNQWTALFALWQRESGWNPAARNPSSGAAGIPQDITGNFHGGAAGQIAWGLNYIRGRYGTPANAWAHELAFGWYDKGGYLPPGLSLALNTTGRREPVGGGTVVNYHVTVHAGIAQNPREVGRQVVEVIRQYEKGSGAGWRK